MSRESLTTDHIVDDTGDCIPQCWCKLPFFKDVRVAMNNLKRIHVNQFVIRHNKKYDNKLPACRVQEGSKSRYCMEVLIMGASHMIYSPDKPLPCGAKLWIETYADVVLLGERPYSEIAEQMKEITK